MPSFNDMVVKACALALRELPARQRRLPRRPLRALLARQRRRRRRRPGRAGRADGLRRRPQGRCGRSPTEPAALAERVRDGAITPPELSGGTFTVSNLGMFGVDEFSAVINPPQAAILAVGAIRSAPVVRDGEVVARNMMNVTLACDHRILYGADGAEFLARVKALLEQPISLAL